MIDLVTNSLDSILIQEPKSVEKGNTMYNIAPRDRRLVQVNKGDLLQIVFPLVFDAMFRISEWPVKYDAKNLFTTNTITSWNFDFLSMFGYEPNWLMVLEMRRTDVLADATSDESLSTLEPISLISFRALSVRTSQIIFFTLAGKVSFPTNCVEINVPYHVGFKGHIGAQ